MVSVEQLVTTEIFVAMAVSPEDAQQQAEEMLEADPEAGHVVEKEVTDSVATLLDDDGLPVEEDDVND